MKFDPTWRQVALLAVLLAAIIVSHLWAPAAVSAITSIVSTIVGALFINLKPLSHEAVAPVLHLVKKEDGKEGGKS